MASNEPTANGPRPLPAAAYNPEAGKIKPNSACIDEEKLLLEAGALALFVGRRGNILANDPKKIAAYEDLRKAVDDACQQTGDNYVALMGAYSAVSAFTYGEHGVNGRTILDTDGRGEYRLFLKQETEEKGVLARAWGTFRRPRHRPLVIGGILLVGIMIYEAILLWLDDTHVLDVRMTKAKELLVPLGWGALGTCTFLIKKLSDRLSEFSFEEARARGMEARVFLGAILALIVVELINAQTGASGGAAGAGAAEAAGTASTISLETYIIAFLAGLGIKPVYAAIESLVEGLAARIKPPKQAGKS